MNKRARVIIANGGFLPAKTYGGPVRFVEMRTENETDLAFDRVPIAELETEESIIGSIIDSIETNTAYASPKLNRLRAIYRFANNCKATESKDTSDRIILDAKKEIVKTIIDDYIDLRKKLKLECEFDIPEVTGTVFEVLGL